MKYAIIDNETTGLGSCDEVIQFACILADEDFNAIRLHNVYCYTQHAINPKAQAVHGISKEMLHELSGGLTLEDHFSKMDDLFKCDDLTWVEWSTSGFDMRLINQTLANNNAKTIDFGSRIARPVIQEGVHNYNLLHGICNLLFGGKTVNLQRAVSVLPYSSDSIERMYRQYISVNGEAGSFHRAEYDAFITWLLLYTYGKKLRC